MDDIALSDDALAHEEPLMLARNLFGRFYDVSRQAGPVFQQPFPARGIAFGGPGWRRQGRRSHQRQ